MIVLEVVDTGAGVLEGEEAEKARKSALHLKGRQGQFLARVLSLMMGLEVLASREKYLTKLTDEVVLVARVVVLHGMHKCGIDVFERGTTT